MEIRIITLYLLTSLLNSLYIMCRETKPLKMSLALQCPPCERVHCHPRRASQLRCPGGITRGPCNCCPKCAKIERQKCGGVHDYLGKCDQGLYCHPDRNQKRPHYSKYPEGKCKKVQATSRSSKNQHDQALPQYCKPKCTPDYCRLYPKAICAAVDNADRKQPCQSSCQHTSCSACRFVEEPACQKCKLDDFRCMRQFAKCVKRKSYCTRHKFPCRKYSNTNETGKFQCMVPECVRV